MWPAAPVSGGGGGCTNGNCVVLTDITSFVKRAWQTPLGTFVSHNKHPAGGEIFTSLLFFVQCGPSGGMLFALDLAICFHTFRSDSFPFAAVTSGEPAKDCARLSPRRWLANFSWKSISYQSICPSVRLSAPTGRLERALSNLGREWLHRRVAGGRQHRAQEGETGRNRCSLQLDKHIYWSSYCWHMWNNISISIFPQWCAFAHRGCTVSTLSACIPSWILSVGWKTWNLKKKKRTEFVYFCLALIKIVARVF